MLFYEHLPLVFYLIGWQERIYLAPKRTPERRPAFPVLFTIVMDVLNAIIQRASEDVLLQPLGHCSLWHRVSFCADDVIMFLRTYGLAFIGWIMAMAACACYFSSSRSCFVATSRDSWRCVFGELRYPWGTWLK